MSEAGGRKSHKQRDVTDSELSFARSGWVFGGFWALLFFCTFLVDAPWAGFHAIFLSGVGLLMLLFPPPVGLPRLWWILAGFFVIAGMGSFLPAAWFKMPEWRGKLEALGLETGPLIAIQSRQAMEGFALFVITLFTGLWLAGHRPSSRQLRLWALMFTCGVAAYAIASKCVQNSAAVESIYGFFPNRNHTATYLAMGAICGLGCVLQSMRDKRFIALGVALLATGVCLWAVAGWSISRGGVVLVVVGCLIWVSLLGRTYLGRHGLWALGLITLTGVGLFFIVDSEVKGRFTKTADKAAESIGTEGEIRSKQESISDLDFRIPTALDTLNLIKDFKWTGIGAGEYFYVFPQYRHLTAVANDADSFHPESDWLWMAAEVGVPATLFLAALVIGAFWRSCGSILEGRDRAIRGGCLVAAALVAIHGLFDVPGHRITLALSAAFLFALSLRPPSVAPSRHSYSRLIFRLMGVMLLIPAGFLARSQWMGGEQWATTTASAALARCQALYEQDQAMQRSAIATGQSYQPPAGNDPIEKALLILERAGSVCPLNRDLLKYQGFLALHFDDKYEMVDRSFLIGRTLDPTWVAGPLYQAEAWSTMDPERAAMLWKEALARARQLDRMDSGCAWSSEKTATRIAHFAKGKPALEKQVQKLGLLSE